MTGITMGERSRALLVTVALALSGYASSPAEAQVTFTVELWASGKEQSLANPAAREFSDDFSRIEIRGGRNCTHGIDVVCLPSDCTLDTSRTYSTSAPGSFGRGGPGYGVVVNSVNIPGGGEASYIYNPATGCLTSTIKVCAKRRQRGWYEGYHVVYGKCATSQPWTGKVNKGPFTLAAGQGPVRLAKYDKLPLGSGNGIPNTATVDKYGVNLISKTPAGAPLELGMFAAAQPPLNSGANGQYLWASSIQANDLRWSAIEVTQGMQNLANEMPLVSQRRTAVRAYARSDVPVSGVRARLRGFRDGKEILPALLPEREIPVLPSGGSRLLMDDSFLFLLPPAWRSGNLTLRVEIDPDGLIPETNEANNFLERTVELQKAIVLNMTGVPLHIHPEGDRKQPTLIYRDNDSSFWKIVDNLYRFHPISSLIYWDCGLKPLEPMGHGFPLHREWDLSSGDDDGQLLSRIAWLRFWNGCGTTDQHWVGMVHPSLDTTINGIAYGPGKASWVWMRSVEGPSWYVYGGATLGHELGHNKGLDHVLCAGGESGTTPHYPYPSPNCRLGQGDDGYFGLDLYHDLWGLPAPVVISNDPLVNPSTQRAFPLMGYKTPRWISPFKYCRLLDKQGIPCDSGQVKSAAEENLSIEEEEKRAVRYLAVGGILEIASGRIEPLDVYVTERPTANARQDLRERRRRVEGARGEVLDLVQIGGDRQPLRTDPAPLNAADGDGRFQPFLELLEMAPGARGVQVRRGNRVLAERRASASAPTVSLLTHNRGGRLLDEQVVRWSASDADGSPLTYDLFYSPDNGATWRPVALQLMKKQYAFTAEDRLPGSRRARLRVQAHDGFHTAEAVSALPLSVPGSAPRVTILQPSGRRVAIGQTVSLNGLATDLDQGPILLPDRFVWRSNRNGVLAAGRELFTRDLSAGTHRITLTVRDDDGNAGVASTVVHVGAPPPSDWTPWLNRDRPSGVGDFETLDGFLAEGKACAQPLEVECRTTDGRDWQVTEQPYLCTRSQGGICVNRDQPDGGSCLDYEVRFLCPTALP